MTLPHVRVYHTGAFLKTYAEFGRDCGNVSCAGCSSKTEGFVLLCIVAIITVTGER